MSADYYIYTEVNIDGKWICINNKHKCIREGTEKLDYTYYSGSRSYFHATADKFEECGCAINYHELSAELQEQFKWSKDDFQYWRIFTVKPEDMRARLPEDSAMKEFCGYVHKNVLFDYQTGEIDDIEESLTADEYLALPEAKRKCYSYYEWDSAYGWYKHFKQILEHFRWQKYEWETVNYSCDKEFQFRLVLLML